MSSLINNTNNNQEDKLINTKKKKILFWSLISLAVAIVLAGVIIGIVLLSNNKNNEDLSSKTDHEKWVDAIVDSNITNPGVSTEDLKIPSNVTLENIVYTSTLYIVVSSNDGEIIYKRNDSVSNPTIIDGFDYNNEFITYDKVVSIYGDYACVKNTSGNIQFIVDLNQEEAIYEVSGFKTIKYYNDICFAYSKSNGYPCLKAIDLKTKSLVLNISTPNNLSKIKFEEDYLLIVSDTNKTYYDYKVEGNSLKTIKSLDFVNKYVDSNYELKENEVKITYEGREFVVGKQSEVILTTPNYILIENKIPTIDYLKANYVDEITYSSWDNELDVAIDNNVHYIVSYQLQNKSNNKITDFETEGMLSLTNDETRGFYYLEVTPFNEFDENGETTLVVADRQTRSTLVVNDDFTQVFIYNAAKYGQIFYYDGESYFTYGGNSAALDSNGYVNNKIINTSIYKITSANVWNNNFIVKRNVYYGISDNHGNVIASTEFKLMAPIVNGYTVAYYDGHYYRLDLTNKTGHLLNNYYSEFHQYVLAGIGYYLEYDEDSKEYSMYTMDGTLKYDNISEIKILDFKLNKHGLYLATMPQIYPEDRGMNYAIKIGYEVAKKIIDAN